MLERWRLVKGMEMVSLSVAISLIALSLAGAVWRAYVLTILWGWFIVPTFGLQQLTLIPAVGLVLTVGYLTHQYMPNVVEEGEKWERKVRPWFFMVMTPAMSLLFGWVFKQWM